MCIFYKKCSWNTTQDIVFVFVVNPHNLCFTNSILPQPPYSVKQKIETFLKFFLWCIINHSLLSKTIIFLSMSNFVAIKLIKISTQYFAIHFKTTKPTHTKYGILNAKNLKVAHLFQLKLVKSINCWYKKQKRCLLI